jgi:hypothetical protein
MEIKIELIISGLLTLSVLIGAIRIYLSKKDDELMIKWISMMSILFGIYLWIKNGLTLDYGTEEQIAQTHAHIMIASGMINILSGLLFIIISIFKYIAWKIKKGGA